MQDQRQWNKAAEPGSGSEKVYGIGNNVHDASPAVLNLSVTRPGQRRQKDCGQERHHPVLVMRRHLRTKAPCRHANRECRKEHARRPNGTETRVMEDRPYCPCIDEIGHAAAHIRGRKRKPA